MILWAEFGVASGKSTAYIAQVMDKTFNGQKVYFIFFKFICSFLNIVLILNIKISFRFFMVLIALLAYQNHGIHYNKGLLQWKEKFQK